MINHHQLNEGLKSGDLENLISHRFTIDEFQSKMGDDADVCVLRFEVSNSEAARDLETFVERAFSFVLDSDVSSAESSQGAFSVFIELERGRGLISDIDQIVQGISRLSKIWNWRFKYFKDILGQDYSIEAVKEKVPQSPEEYRIKIEKSKLSDIKEMFVAPNFSKISIANDELTFERPFSGPLRMRIVNLGQFQDISESIPGAVNLSEQAQGKISFLEKYLGPCDLTAIGDLILIRGDKLSITVELI